MLLTVEYIGESFDKFCVRYEGLYYIVSRVQTDVIHYRCPGHPPIYKVNAAFIANGSKESCNTKL
jgi:hypothetical protein